MHALNQFNQTIPSCSRCPRLIAWCRQVAREKRAAYKACNYWGRPVPSFGDYDAQLLIIGLAPAAHGANRTGRMFTGDRSGLWLYRALYRAGFANQPESIDRNDGLELINAYISAVVRCAPPANKPAPEETSNCLPYLKRELEWLTSLRAIVCLGGFAWNGLGRIIREQTEMHGKQRLVPFGHGAHSTIHLRHGLQPIEVIGSYHPSQQNTFTGRLREEMFDDIFHRAQQLIQESGRF